MLEEGSSVGGHKLLVLWYPHLLPTLLGPTKLSPISQWLWGGIENAAPAQRGLE